MKPSLFVRQAASTSAFVGSESWVILSPIEQSIRRKIEAVGTPLREWDIQINYGIKTGCNEAFIISTAMREEILAACATEDERQRTAELIRPILRGRDIKRYKYEWKDLWLINTHNGVRGRIPRIRIEDYPAVKAHLDQFWSQIKARADQGDTPYNLRNCAYMEDFQRPKIVWGEISDKSKFAFDFNGEYVPEATTFLMTGEHIEYLLAALNSKVSEWLFSKTGTTTGVGTVRWKKYTIEQLLVARPDKTQMKDYLAAFEKLKSNEMSAEEFDKFSNNFLNAIYCLKPNEIRYLEGRED